MSKIGEWLRLIPEGIQNPLGIIEGVTNQVKQATVGLKEDEQEEIIRRRLICDSCPFMSKNATTSEEYKELVGKNYSTSRDDEHCTFCGCPLSTRTSSLGSPCGINSWNKNHKDRKLPLKWDVYGKSN